MGDIANEVVTVSIEQELRQSYLDYAMSVIVGRALPDVRDGLKPVHRRILFAMHELRNDWNKPYKKSARIVGDVIGKYHPHGELAIYDAIVRMAQDFSMRYLLVDGQGNFGSVDGDKAAAMRYTEIRMSKLSHVLLSDLEKETVDFIPNYDGTEHIPEVMPTRVPNLLINGSSGIAVGMATNIPPHNIGEVINACLALLDNPDLSIDALMTHIPGPDFPTAAIINGRAGILSAYRTGKGRIYLRAQAQVEEDSRNRQRIVISQLPYQVNKARLLEKIAELVKERKIEGITEIRDESDKDGMRVVIELRRGEVGEVVLNNLYVQTPLENVYGINMVALIDGQPRQLNLKEFLEAFLRHRREVVTRRTLFELRKAYERCHLLEGLAVALANIDQVIALIKAAKSPQEAKEQLLDARWPGQEIVAMLERSQAAQPPPDEVSASRGLQTDGYYRLTVAQAQAILEMKLHRLTGLEQDRLWQEYQEILTNIAYLKAILAEPARLLQVIREELQAISAEFSDPRKSQIVTSKQDLTEEDLITEEEMVVTLSHEGYVKRVALDVYQAQKRGGRGKSAANMKAQDYVENLLVVNSHTQLLLFTTAGKVFWLKTYQLPLATRTSRGRPIVNILSLQEEESVTAILPVEAFTDADFVVMATARGTVKKVALSAFARPRTAGLIAVDLVENDRLIGVALTDGKQNIMLLSDAGKAVSFAEENVRVLGRTARGVRGMKLAPGQSVIALIISQPEQDVLLATSNGYGKRTKMSEFSVRGRGTQGVIAIQCSDRNGSLVGACQVKNGQEIMLITDQSTIVRTRVDEISVVGRNTQGVRLIKLKSGESLVGLEVIDEPHGESQESVDTDQNATALGISSFPRTEDDT